MIKIGLTGGIGAGKTTVAKYLEKKGYPVFYSDDEAKKIMESNVFVIQSIKKIFGEDAYSPENTLNREKIATKIFSNPELKNKLNQIVHPEVRKYFNQWSAAQKSNIVFNEAAILFETGSYKDFDFTILVTAPEELRIQRVMERDNATRNAVKARIANQWKEDKKKQLADFVLINDGKESIETQIEIIIHTISQRA